MIEPWSPQFFDNATFYTITYSTSADGQQTKSETLLYSGIPCNLLVLGVRGVGNVKQIEGQDEEFQEFFRCDVTAEYGGANKGDRVVINGENYIITRRIADTDFCGTILFYKYSLQELE